MIREARIKVLTADVTAKTDTLQEYSQRKRDSYVVLNGVAPLDKTRAAHFKSALTPKGFEERKGEDMTLALSTLVSTFTRKELSLIHI